MNKDHLSIMTMNLRFGLAKDGDNGWEQRRDLVGQTLDRCRADFYGFQEVNHFQAAFLDDHLRDHTGIGRYNREVPWWQSNMIFHHKSWTCLGFRHHFISHTPDIPSKLSGSKWPRQCVIGWFEKQDRQVVVANTHFDFETCVQVRSADLVMNFLDRFPQGLPTAICGDFNSEPGSPAHERFCARGFDEVCSDEKQTTFHEFKGGDSGPHIDWILFRNGFSVWSSQVVTDDFSGRFPSDHYPVQAVFEYQFTEPDRKTDYRKTDQWETDHEG